MRYRNRTRGTRTGFTLIELLIVVAIIGILAAIAVPNFLNAQTRSKIAKNESDMKAIATAMEMYMLDHNAYPGDHDLDNYMNNEKGLFRLTTPIAYIASLPSDPFITRELAGTFALGDSNAYASDGRPDYEVGCGSDNPEAFRVHAYSIMGYGPDGDDDIGTHDPFPFGVHIKLYDATNGLRSNGDTSRIGGEYMRGCITYNWGAYRIGSACP